MIADRAAVVQALGIAEDFAHEMGWDQPPALMALTAADSGELRFAAMPGWDLLVAMGTHPVQALHVLTAALSDPSAPPLPPQTIAVVLITETWSVARQPGQAAPSGSFAVHPDRVEGRVALLAAVDGSGCAVMRNRGSKPLHEPGAMPGRLTDALTRLARVVSREPARWN